MSSLMKFPIGTRRLRLTLEEPVESPDGMGGVTRSFAARVELWGRLAPVSAVERAEAVRAEQAVTHRLTLRWRGDVTAAMRLTAPGRVFNILACHDPDERRRDLVCLVEEVSP